MNDTRGLLSVRLEGRLNARLLLSIKSETILEINMNQFSQTFTKAKNINLFLIIC